MSIPRKGSKAVDNELPTVFEGQRQVALGSEWRPNVVIVSRRTLIEREYLSDEMKILGSGGL